MTCWGPGVQGGGGGVTGFMIPSCYMLNRTTAQLYTSRSCIFEKQKQRMVEPLNLAREAQLQTLNLDLRQLQSRSSIDAAWGGGGLQGKFDPVGQHWGRDPVILRSFQMLTLGRLTLRLVDTSRTLPKWPQFMSKMTWILALCPSSQWWFILSIPLGLGFSPGMAT